MPTGTDRRDLDGLIYFRVPMRVKKEFKIKANKLGKTPSSLGRELVLSFLNFESTKEKVDAA